MTVFYFNFFMNGAATLFSTIPIMIAAIQKLTTKMGTSIESNPQFGKVFTVLPTTTTV